MIYRAMSQMEMKLVMTTTVGSCCEKEVKQSL